MDDRIQKTIERLKSLALDGDSNENLSAICDVLYGGKPDFGWTKGACEWLRDALVGLLEQHDPADWSDSYLAEQGLVRGPVDADGVMWHSGDMSDTTWGVIEGIAYSSGQWLVCGHDISAPWIPADSIRHYHKPTVPEILDELEGLRGTGDYEAVVTRAAELAGQLRELMQDD